jgi:hypothetical protein
MRRSPSGLTMQIGSAPRSRIHGKKSPISVVHKPVATPQGKVCDELPRVIIADGTKSASARDAAAPLPPPRAPQNHDNAIAGTPRWRTPDPQMLRKKARLYESLLQQMEDDHVYGRRTDPGAWRRMDRTVEVGCTS